MKKVLIAMLSIMIAFSVTAQSDKNNKKNIDQLKKEKPEHKQFGQRKGPKVEKLNNLQNRLDLTETQGQQIKEVNLDFKSKMQALKKDDQLTSAQKKEQAEVLQKQHTESIRAVLTIEQRNKLEEFKKNRPNRRNAR